MKVLLSWLRDFVDVPGTASAIATTMSVRGFAVEGIEPLGDDDAVIDFEVTANRPDCLSVVGMAREIATAYGLQLRRPAVRERSSEQAPQRSAGAPSLHLASLKVTETSDVPITIEAPELCPRYVGAIADVVIGPSPDWMQQRLRAGGVRPINNVVDVTNYVLLELGQPMHAFDLARLTGPAIIVREAAEGERIRTLDGDTRLLAAGMLVIADARDAIAIAGIKGGASSEVTAATTTIVFESAYFQPLAVRRTSKALGLKTDASMRFERGTDPRLPITAMERACALLEVIGAGRPRGTVLDRHPRRTEPTVLRLRREKLSGLLGTVVPDTEVRRILDGLGFAMRDTDDGWDVTAPTRRVDMQREVDLIEEVARHYGLDRIPVRFPALTVAPGPVNRRISRARALRRLLTGAGFSEAVTFGFVSAAAAADFCAPDGLVSIANPLSETFAVLRPSILPGLVDVVAHNSRREQPDVRVFEIGARFRQPQGEQQALACAWSGAVGEHHWSGGHRPVDFFDIKGLAERVTAALGITVTAVPHEAAWLAPGQAAALAAPEGRVIGVAGRLARTVAERHGLDPATPVFVAELDLDAIDAVGTGSRWRVAPLPRHPSVTRDISIVVPDTTPAAALRATIAQVAPSTLVRVREFDRYQGKGVPAQHVSLSIRLTFRAGDRTLTDAEVQEAMTAVLEALRTRHAAVQR